MGCVSSNVVAPSLDHSKKESSLNEAKEDTDSQEARSGGSETQSSSKPFITHFKPFTPRMNLAQDPFLSLNNENHSVDGLQDNTRYYQPNPPLTPLTPQIKSSKISLSHRPNSPFISPSIGNACEPTSSQIDFFKMLDKKIEEGRDYVD